MDPNEKIQLDDISFDDVIGGEGVATEEIAPAQEDEKKVESPDEPLLEEEEIEEEEEEKELEEDEEDDPLLYDDKEEEDEFEVEEDDDSIVGAVLDKLGYEVDEAYPDTTEGLVELTKDMASQLADERIDNVLGKFPLVKQHLEYVLQGGESQNFMKTHDPNIDYNNLDINPKDTRSQKAILGDYLAIKGHETDFIKEMLEDYEDTGKLRDRSEAARQALGKYQEEEKQQLLEKQKETNQAKYEEIQEFWGGVADTIENSSEFAGLTVSESDKNDFYTYLSTPITEEGYTQRDVDHSEADMETKLAIDYLMFKGFDLDTIISTKARTQNVKSLKDRIAGNNERSKSARKSVRRSVKFDIDDLDFNI